MSLQNFVQVVSLITQKNFFLCKPKSLEFPKLLVITYLLPLQN